VTAVADPSDPQLGRRDADFLARPAALEIDPEGPVDCEHIETEKAETGQAPIRKHASPAAKLMTMMKAINAKKPARFIDRCGVSNAENNSG